MPDLSSIPQTSNTQGRSPDAVPLSAVVRELGVLAVVCAFLLLFGFSSLGLVGADEPRYAQIAREMLARHDWVTPVLYGRPWLEKPVLYYWEAMVAYRLFGVSDWAARIPGVFSVTLMVSAIYAFMRRFRPGAQFAAAVITISSAGVLGFGRAASTDMPLASAFTLAMLAWAAWYETHRRLWLACFYVFCGVGVLAKGPVAVLLAAMILVALAALKRRAALIWQTIWLPGILLLAVVVLPWYVAVQIRAPQFFRIFILEQNLARFGSNIFQHHQPFWYYLVVLPLGVLPWLALWIAALAGTRPHRPQTVSLAGRDLELLLLLWIVLPIIFFSFSGSKLPGYVLPCVPACAMLVASYLRRVQLQGGRLPWGWLLAHALVCGVVLGAVLLSQYLILRLRPTGHAVILASAMAAAVVVVVVALTRTRGLQVLPFATLIPVILGMTFLLKIGAAGIDARFSARPVAREIESLHLPRLPLAGFAIPRETEYGLAFYRNQQLLRYERSEVPAGEHLLITATQPGAPNEPDFGSLGLAGRKLVQLGGYRPQGLQFFWVSASAK